jgi:hypothetical protein
MAMPKKAVNGNLSLVSLVSKSTGGTIPIPKRKKRSISLQLGPKIPLIDGLEPSFTKKGINNATLSMGDVDPNLQPELMIHRNQNYDVNSRLFASAKQRKWDEVIKIIESNGADLEADWEDPNFFSKQSALHFAATHNQATVCEMLVTKCFFNPLKPDRFGRSAWSVSSERGHDFTTRLLEWYKPLNVSRRNLKAFQGYKGRRLESHKKYRKTKKKKAAPIDDMEGIGFTGKTVDVFQKEYKEMRSDMISTRKAEVDRRKTKNRLRRKTLRKAEKLRKEGFLPSMKDIR